MSVTRSTTLNAIIAAKIELYLDLVGTAVPIPKTYGKQRRCSMSLWAEGCSTATTKRSFVWGTLPHNDSDNEAYM